MGLVADLTERWRFLVGPWLLLALGVAMALGLWFGGSYGDRVVNKVIESIDADSSLVTFRVSREWKSLDSAEQDELIRMILDLGDIDDIGAAGDPFVRSIAFLVCNADGSPVLSVDLMRRSTAPSWVLLLTTVPKEHLGFYDGEPIAEWVANSSTMRAALNPEKADRFFARSKGMWDLQPVDDPGAFCQLE